MSCSLVSEVEIKETVDKPDVNTKDLLHGAMTTVNTQDLLSGAMTTKGIHIFYEITLKCVWIASNHFLISKHL